MTGVEEFMEGMGKGNASRAARLYDGRGLVIGMCVYLCVYIYINIICVCVCVCIYIYIMYVYIISIYVYNYVLY